LKGHYALCFKTHASFGARCENLNEDRSTVWVKKKPHAVFWNFFPNGWEYFNQFLHTYYTFLSTLDNKFLFNYLQLWRSYAILSVTTLRIFTFH